MSDPVECLADETLFAFALGQLAPESVADVEHHLSGCDECRSVVAETARSLVGEPSARAASEGVRRIGRYDLQGLLGAGAYGVVYRAFDPDLRRTVALKVLRPDEHSADPQRRERMVREAQAMAQLSHPNVVTVYDVGLHADSVYIVMEHVAGGTARDFLAHGQRSTAEILDVYAKAGRGLAAAHEKGLVHRDFKPDNVLVGDDGRVRVTDFGLARIASGGAPEAPVHDPTQPVDLTATKGIIGTPSYVAPEQFAGGAADARSDQFSFCVALFAALYGRHPFRAEHGLTLDELSMRVRSGMVEDIAEAERVPHVHELLLRGLEPNPARRLPDMAALLAALDGAGKSPQRARARVWLAGVASLLVLGTIWVATRRTQAAAPSVASVPSAVPTSPPVPVPVVPSSAELPRVLSAAPSAVPRQRPRAAPNKISKPREQRYVDGLKEPF